MEKNWRQKAHNERQELMVRLFNKYQIVGTPQALKMFDIAWEEGHASGEHDVENWVQKLKELLNNPT